MNLSEHLFKNILKPLIFSYLGYLFFAIVFYFAIAPYLELTEKSHITKIVTIAIECLLLLFVHIILFIITKRNVLSFLLLVLMYLIFIFSNLIKINYLNAPLYPSDFILAGDLIRTWDLFKQFVPYLFLVMSIIIILFYYGFKLEKPHKKYSPTTKLYLLFICAISIFIINYDLRNELRHSKLYFRKNANLTTNALKFGFFNNFIVAFIFQGKPEAPNNYNLPTIQKIVDKYSLNVSSFYEKDKPDNVIILLIEAFTNPHDFGWQFSNNPIPTFTSIIENQSSGYVYSPVFGGKSINAEYELMTGMSTQFIPEESTPYREFIDRDIPSIARTFKQSGYETNAIQVISFHGFGYERIYDYLGVDNKVSLSIKNNKSLEADPSNKSTSNKEIAKKISELTDNQKKSFIFAFPNASHAPWNIEDYTDSNINLTSKIENKAITESISAYANAMNHADLLLKLLLEKYTTSDEPTMIIVLGDHQPGLEYYNDNYVLNKKYDYSINQIIKMYEVPIAIWTNYDTKNDSILLSMNFLSSYITESANINQKGFIKFNNIVRKKINVLSKLYHEPNNSYTDSVPNNAATIIEEYNLLQYDILFGENFLDTLIK